MPNEPLLSIAVLGPVKIAFAGRELRIRLRKSRALLAYIALSDNLSEARERLVGLFWGDSEEQKAQDSLRQVVHELNEEFRKAGFCGFRADRQAVGLDRTRIDVDLANVIRDSEACRVHPLLLERERLADCLLEGLDDLDDSFQIWLRAKRRTVHDRLLRVLEDGMRDEAVDARARVRLAEAIFNLDPSHEEACRHVMRAKAEARDTPGAIRAYERLYNWLNDEYGMDPSDETVQLIADIKMGKIRQATPAEPIPPQDRIVPGNDVPVSNFSQN